MGTEKKALVGTVWVYNGTKKAETLGFVLIRNESDITYSLFGRTQCLSGWAGRSSREASLAQLDYLVALSSKPSSILDAQGCIRS